MSNVEVELTLDEAVDEVLGLLTGLDLTYAPELDRYRAITRQLNRAMRHNALENEWSYYATTLDLGTVSYGQREVLMPSSARARIIGDDSVRLVYPDGRVARFVYFLPRDALPKYERRIGLWCAVVRQSIWFSREITQIEQDEQLSVLVPVMREPKMFRLPEAGKKVASSIRKQPVDFPWPDVVIARAAWYYAQTDPVMQPRAQTLEDGYKDLMYQIIERDTSHTDTPYQNVFTLPIESGLVDESAYRVPLADY
jgi:hypothetical protein